MTEPAAFVLSNLAVDGERLRLLLTATKPLDPNVLKLVFIADNQSAQPFVKEWDRELIQSKLVETDSFELIVSDLPIGFKYTYLLQSVWADASERQVSRAEGVSPSFTLASAPGAAILSLKEAPELVGSSNRITVKNIILLATLPAKTGAAAISSLTVFVNTGSQLLKEEFEVSEDDRKKGSVTANIDVVSLDGPGIVTLFATVGNIAGESPMSNVLSITANIIPNAPTGLIAISRHISDASELAIPVSMSVDGSDLPKWNYYSILALVGEDYLSTDLLNIAKPDDLSSGQAIEAVVTSVNDNQLSAFTTYKLVGVLSYGQLRDDDLSDRTSSFGSGDSPIATAFTTFVQEKVTAEFTKDNTVQVETDGALTVAFALKNLLPNEASGSLKVLFQLFKNNNLVFSSTETYSGDNVDKYAMSKVLKSGNWSASDNLRLFIKVFKGLRASQVADNVKPPLDTAPNVILSEFTLDFRAPQPLPDVSFTGMDSANLVQDAARLQLAHARWSQPVLPVGMSIVKYQIRGNSYEGTNNLFRLENGVDLQSILEIISLDTTGDIQERKLISRINGDGDPITLAPGGDSVFFQIRGIFNENSVDRDGKWSDWFEYVVPSDALPPVVSADAEESALGEATVLVVPPVLADIPADWSFDSFLIRLYSQKGDLLSETPVSRVAGKTEYKQKLVLDQSVLDQYVMINVISKFVNTLTNKLSFGSVIQAPRIFMHKAISITEVSLNYSSDNTKLTVNAIVDNGALPDAANVVAIVPHLSSGVSVNTRLHATMDFDATAKRYKTGVLDLVPGFDNKKVVVYVAAANTVSMDVDFMPRS